MKRMQSSNLAQAGEDLRIGEEFLDEVVLRGIANALRGSLFLPSVGVVQAGDGWVGGIGGCQGDFSVWWRGVWL